MAEFVKFLPGVQSGPVSLTRELFLMPPAAVVTSVALLVASRQLRYSTATVAILLILAASFSLQLLPPAWSPASLQASEFRPQAIGLLVVWSLLATFWIWSRLPMLLSSSLSAVLGLAAAGCSAWQFITAKPFVDAVYRTVPSAGWGLFVCLAGLVIDAVASAGLAVASVRMRR